LIGKREEANHFFPFKPNHCFTLLVCPKVFVFFRLERNNMTTSTAIVPGMRVKVIDPHESPEEWIDFTVISVHRFRVNLLSSSGIKTWARIDEICYPHSDELSASA